MRSLALIGFLVLYGCASTDARRVDCVAHLADINPVDKAKPNPFAAAPEESTDAY